MLPLEPPGGRGFAGGGGDEKSDDDLCGSDGAFAFVSPPKTCDPRTHPGRRSSGGLSFFAGCERADDTLRALAASSSYVSPLACSLPLDLEEAGGGQGDRPARKEGEAGAGAPLSQSEPERGDAALSQLPAAGRSGFQPGGASFAYPLSSPAYLPLSSHGHAPPQYSSPLCYPSASPCGSSLSSCASAPSAHPPAPLASPGGDSAGVLYAVPDGSSTSAAPPTAWSACGGGAPSAPLSPGEPGLAQRFLSHSVQPLPCGASPFPFSASASPNVPLQALPGEMAHSGYARQYSASAAFPPAQAPSQPCDTPPPAFFQQPLRLSAPATGSVPCAPSFPAESPACASASSGPLPGAPCTFFSAPSSPPPSSVAAGACSPPPPSSSSSSVSCCSTPSARSAARSPARSGADVEPKAPGGAVADGALLSGEAGVRGGHLAGSREAAGASWPAAGGATPTRNVRRPRREDARRDESPPRPRGLRIASRFPGALAVLPDAAHALRLPVPCARGPREETDDGGERECKPEEEEAPARKEDPPGPRGEAASSFSSMLLYLAAERLVAEGENELSSAVYRHLVKSRQKAAAQQLPSCHNWQGEVRLLTPAESSMVLPRPVRPPAQRWSLTTPGSAGRGLDGEEAGAEGDRRRRMEQSTTGRETAGAERLTRRAPASAAASSCESPGLRQEFQVFMSDLIFLLSSRMSGQLSVEDFLRHSWPPNLALLATTVERPRSLGGVATGARSSEDLSLAAPQGPSFSSPQLHLLRCRATPFSPVSSHSWTSSPGPLFSFSRNLFLLHRSGRFSRALSLPPRAAFPSCSDCCTLSSGFILTSAAHAFSPSASPLLMSASLVKNGAVLGAMPRGVAPAAAAAFASGAGTQAAAPTAVAAGPWLAWSRRVKRVANIWGHQISHEELLSGERPALDNQFQIGLVREPAAVYVVRYDATGSVILTGGDDGLVKVWDAATGQLIYALIKHQGDITDIDLHPNNSLLLSGCGKGEVRLWRILPAGWIPVCAVLVPERVAWARFLAARRRAGRGDRSYGPRAAFSEQEQVRGREEGDSTRLWRGGHQRAQGGAPAGGMDSEETDALAAVTKRGEGAEEREGADDDDDDPVSLVIVGCDDRKIRFYDLRALLETPPLGGPGGRSPVLPLLEAEWGTSLLPRAMDLSKVPLDASGSFLLALGLEAPEPGGDSPGSPQHAATAPPTSSPSVLTCSLLASGGATGPSDGGVHTRSASPPASSAYRALVVRTPSAAQLRALRRLRREEEERDRLERRRRDGEKLLGVEARKGPEEGTGDRDDGRRRTRFGGDARAGKADNDKHAQPGLLFADLTPSHCAFPDVCFAWHSADLVTGGDDGNVFLWSFSSLAAASSPPSASPYASRLRSSSSASSAWPAGRRGFAGELASANTPSKFFLLSLSIQRLLEGRYLPGSSARARPSSPLFPFSPVSLGDGACSSASAFPLLQASSGGSRPQSGSAGGSGGAVPAPTSSPASSQAHSSHRYGSGGRGGWGAGGRSQHGRGGGGGGSGRHSSSSSISSSSSEGSGSSDSDEGAEGEAAGGSRCGRRGRPPCRPPRFVRGGAGGREGGPAAGAAAGSSGGFEDKDILAAGVGDSPRHAADASGVRYNLLALAFTCDDSLVCVADAVSRKTSKARMETLKPLDQSLSIFPSPPAVSVAAPGARLPPPRPKTCRVGALSFQGVTEGLVSQLKPHPVSPVLMVCSTFRGEILLLDMSEARARARAGLGGGVVHSPRAAWGEPAGRASAGGRAASSSPCGEEDADGWGSAQPASEWEEAGGSEEEEKQALPWHWEGGCVVLRKLRLGSQCSWLDLAWAPNGLQFAGTHRLGCLSIFADGSSPLFEVTLFEQFLSSEYRDTHRDSDSLLLTDAGTRQAPHLLSRGILMDAARQPYPLHVQPASLVLPFLSVGCRNAHLHMCMRCLRRRLPGALRSDAALFLKKMYCREKASGNASAFASLLISPCPCCPSSEKAWQFADPSKCPFCYGDSSVGAAAPDGTRELGDAQGGPAGRGRRAETDGGGSGQRGESRTAFRLWQCLPPTSDLASRLESLLRRRVRRRAIHLLRSSQQRKVEDLSDLSPAPAVAAGVAAADSSAPSACPASPAQAEAPRGGARETVEAPQGTEVPERVTDAKPVGDRDAGNCGGAADAAREGRGDPSETQVAEERALEDGQHGVDSGDQQAERKRQGVDEGRSRARGELAAGVPLRRDEDNLLSDEEGDMHASLQGAPWVEESDRQPERHEGGRPGGRAYSATSDVAVSNEARRLAILHRHRLEHHCIWKLQRSSSRGNILILRTFVASLLQGRRMPVALVRPPLEDEAWLTQVNAFSSFSSPPPQTARQAWGSARALGGDSGASSSRVSPPPRRGAASRRVRDRDDSERESDSDFELHDDEHAEGSHRALPSGSLQRGGTTGAWGSSGGVSGAGGAVSRSGRVVGFQDLHQRAGGEHSSPPASSSTRLSSRIALRRGVADFQSLSSPILSGSAGRAGGGVPGAVASGRGSRRRGSRWRLMPDEGWSSEGSSDDADDGRRGDEAERDRRAGRRSCRLAGESTVNPIAMLQDPTLPANVQRVLRQLLDDDDLKQLRQQERQSQKEKQAREKKKHAARGGPGGSAGTDDDEEAEGLWGELPVDRIDAEGREQHLLCLASLLKPEREAAAATLEAQWVSTGHVKPAGEASQAAEMAEPRGAAGSPSPHGCSSQPSPLAELGSTSSLVPTGVRRSERTQASSSWASSASASPSVSSSSSTAAQRSPSDAPAPLEDCTLCGVAHRCKLCGLGASSLAVPDWRFINTLEDFDEAGHAEEDKKAYHSRLLAGEAPPSSVLHLPLGELVGPFFLASLGAHRDGSGASSARGEPRRRGPRGDEKEREMEELAGVWVHTRCLMAVSELDVDCHARGFNNLKMRVEEARSHTCSFCSTRGPTVQCTFCPRTFHYPCSLKSYLASGLTAHQLGFPASTASFALPASAVALPASSFSSYLSIAFSSTSLVGDSPAMREARVAAFLAAGKLQPLQRTRCLPDPLYYGRYVCFWCRKSRQMKTLLSYLTGEVFLSARSREWLTVSHRCPAGFISASNPPLVSASADPPRASPSPPYSCCASSSLCRVLPLPPVGSFAPKPKAPERGGRRGRGALQSPGEQEARHGAPEAACDRTGEPLSAAESHKDETMRAGQTEKAEVQPESQGDQPTPSETAKDHGEAAGGGRVSGLRFSRSEIEEHGGETEALLDSVTLPPEDELPCCFTSVGVYVPQLGDVLRYFPHLHQNPVLPHDRVQLWQPEIFLPCDVLVTNISYEFPGLPVDEEPVAVFAVLELSVVRPECLYGRRFEVHFAPSLDGEADYLVPLLDVNRGLLRLAQLREGEDCRAYMDGKFYTARVEHIKRGPPALLKEALCGKKPAPTDSATAALESVLPPQPLGDADAARPHPSLLAAAASAVRVVAGPKAGEARPFAKDEAAGDRGGAALPAAASSGVAASNPATTAAQDGGREVSASSSSGSEASAGRAGRVDGAPQGEDGGEEHAGGLLEGAEARAPAVDGALAVQAALAPCDWPVFPTPGVVNCARLLRLGGEKMTARVLQELGDKAHSSRLGAAFFAERTQEMGRWSQIAGLGLEAIRVHYYNEEEEARLKGASPPTAATGSGEGSRSRGAEAGARGKGASATPLGESEGADDQEQWLNAWEVDFALGARDTLHATLQRQLQEAEFPRARQLELFAALDALMLMEDDEGEDARESSKRGAARRRAERGAGRRRRGRSRRRRQAAEDADAGGEEDEDEGGEMHERERSEGKDEGDEEASTAALQSGDTSAAAGSPVFELFIDPIATIGDTRGARRAAPSWLERYWKEVPLPISLSLIRERLWNGYYRREPALHFDFHLLLHDCRLFNPPGDPVHTLSYRLEEELMRRDLLPKAPLTPTTDKPWGFAPGRGPETPGADPSPQNLFAHLRRHTETQLALARELEARIQRTAVEWVEEARETAGAEEETAAAKAEMHARHTSGDAPEKLEGRGRGDEETRREDERRRQARLRRFEGEASRSGSPQEVKSSARWRDAPPGERNGLRRSDHASEAAGGRASAEDSTACQAAQAVKPDVTHVAPSHGDFHSASAVRPTLGTETAVGAGGSSRLTGEGSRGEASLPEDETFAACASRKRASPEEGGEAPTGDESACDDVSPANRTKRPRTVRDPPPSSPSSASASSASSFLGGFRDVDGVSQESAELGREARLRDRFSASPRDSSASENSRAASSSWLNGPEGLVGAGCSGARASGAPVLGTTRSGRVVKRNVMFSEASEREEEDEKGRGGGGGVKDRERRASRHRDADSLATASGRSERPAGSVAGAGRRGRRTRAGARDAEGDEPRAGGDDGEDEDLKKVLALSVQTFKEEQARKQSKKDGDGNGATHATMNREGVDSCTSRGATPIEAMNGTRIGTRAHVAEGGESERGVGAAVFVEPSGLMASESGRLLAARARGRARGRVKGEEDSLAESSEDGDEEDEEDSIDEDDEEYNEDEKPGARRGQNKPRGGRPPPRGSRGRGSRKTHLGGSLRARKRRRSAGSDSSSFFSGSDGDAEDLSPTGRPERRRLVAARPSPESEPAGIRRPSRTKNAQR
ncbi:hypothetical protein BESB_072950 [Besnoitia besnoiti]|uniref:Bromo domain-containing protein n=1 Tax=Besnoitia besnoiti TaxID=94643 RepID=A0A2A9MEP2_BESBE|nr:uncharacterized protein BESB_072950 [Besnoitia besnoiti]PFH34143.1 hypothetical protein BESB_072950 [Besnoitia besnoiti]